MEDQETPVAEAAEEAPAMPEDERRETVELEHRSVEVRKDWMDQEKRTVRIAVSSEEPVERDFGLEILEHSAEAIDLEFLGSGRAPLLLDHDPRQQIGVIERTEIGSDAVLRADVRFGNGALADEVFQDVVDGIRANISVGYRIDKMSKNERSDGTVEFRAVAWTPMETSIVSIPADKSVGIGRSATIQPTVKKEIPIMENEVDVEEVRAEAGESARAAYSKQVTEIIALGAKHNKRDLAEDSIGKGYSIEQFRGLLLEKIGDAKPLEVAEPELNPRERNEYSLMRAIRAAASNDWREAGFEREVSDEIGHVSGRTAKGFFVPGHAWGQRDLIAGSDADGGHLKGVNHMGSEFIEALRSRLVVGSMGARVMSGLKGDVSIPKMATVAAAAFVAENNAVAEQNQTFGELALVPRTLGVMTDISRKLMLQSDPSAEAIVRNDLLNAVAAKIESVSIAGGGSNEPTGITGTTGIGSVAIGTNGGVPTFASAVNLVKEVEQDNAAISDSMGYLTNSKVKAKLASTAKVSSSDSVMILDAPWTELYGYNFGVTNHVPSNLTKGSTSGTCSAMIFGDFSQMILAFWSSPDVLIDPYTNSSKGGTRVVVFQDCDVGIRHAQSFAACLDYTTT
jgi:HK97 family phage major capsid protein